MMHRSISLLPPLLLLASCSFSTKLTGPGMSGTSSSSSSGGSSSGIDSSSSSSNTQIPMPELLGKKPEEAEQILRKAGFEPRRVVPATQNYACDYDRHASFPLFTICYQRPAPGQLAPKQVHVEYQIERSLPGRGEIGTPNEYVLLPDVRGMSLDEAKKVLAGVGLPVEQHFHIEVAKPGDRCEYEVVCRTIPGAKMRKLLTSRATLVVGMAKPATPPSQPAPPNQPAPPSQPEKPGSFF